VIAAHAIASARELLVGEKEVVRPEVDDDVVSVASDVSGVEEAQNHSHVVESLGGVELVGIGVETQSLQGIMVDADGVDDYA
jgi:hypothetical protein